MTNVVRVWQGGIVQVAGILTESAGYPVDDMPSMVGALLCQLLDICEHEHVEPIGTLEVQRIAMWDGTESGFAWRLVLA